MTFLAQARPQSMVRPTTALSSVRWAFAALLLILLFPLLGRDIYTPDEPREFALVVNMIHGGSWLIPELAGQPFLEKPPLLYWTACIFMTLLGESIEVARLGNLLWALITVSCVALLAAEMVPLQRSRAALLSVLFIVTSWVTLHVQVWFATDAPLLAATSLILLAAWRGFHGDSTSASAPLRWRDGVLFWAGMLLAFFAKNLFGWMVPVMALGGWLLLKGSWQRVLQRAFLIPALIALGVVLFWMLQVWQRPAGAHELRIMLIDNNLGRLLPIATQENYAQGHRNSRLATLLNFPVLILPWTLVVIAAIRAAVRSLRNRTESSVSDATLFLTCATVPGALILLSSTTTRDVYFATLIPAVCVLTSTWLARHDAFDSFERRCLQWNGYLLWLMALLLWLATGVVVWLYGWPASTRVLSGLVAAVVVIATAASLRRALPVMHVPVMALLLSLLGCGVFALPGLDRSQEIGALIRQAAPQLRGRQVALYCGDETVQAALDYAARMHLVDVCGARQLAAWRAANATAPVLAEIAPDPSPRMAILLQTLHLQHRKKRSLLEHVEALRAAGLQQQATWSSPDGRGYAMFEPAIP